VKNSELVTAPNKLLGAIEQQKQHILRINSVRMPCPNCGHKLNVFEAMNVSIDDYETGALLEANTHCTACKRKLCYTVPIVSAGNPWHWTLVPIPVSDTK
jgi:hypothetical protein